jgi:hypothetical protein
VDGQPGNLIESEAKTDASHHDGATADECADAKSSNAHGTANDQACFCTYDATSGPRRSACESFTWLQAAKSPGG